MVITTVGTFLAGVAIGIRSTYLFTKTYFKEHMDLGLAAGEDHTTCLLLSINSKPKYSIYRN